MQKQQPKRNRISVQEKLFSFFCNKEFKSLSQKFCFRLRSSSCSSAFIFHGFLPAWEWIFFVFEPKFVISRTVLRSTNPLLLFLQKGRGKKKENSQSSREKKQKCFFRIFARARRSKLFYSWWLSDGLGIICGRPGAASKQKFWNFKKKKESFFIFISWWFIPPTKIHVRSEERRGIDTNWLTDERKEPSYQYSYRTFFFWVLFHRRTNPQPQ